MRDFVPRWPRDSIEAAFVAATVGRPSCSSSQASSITRSPTKLWSRSCASLADVPDGTWLTVRADVEDGLAIVEEQVFIYAPELHPLKGFWHEIARIPCGGGPEYVPDDPINELYFTASGRMGVTWTPFEVYVDYWGDYAADYDAGSISLSDLDGNYLPDDIDPDGSLRFEGDELVLTDMWLGSSQGSVDPPACGHRFAH